MSDGVFSFLSWVRRGLATRLETSATALSTQTNVRVTFNGDADLQPTATLDLLGPGDIVGLDSAVVVRTWPKADDPEAEFIPYALIEFDQADLPWRYSPQPSDETTTALTPWFVLVVLKATEGTLVPPTSEQKIAVLSVTDVGALPTWDELFAWTHTQFEGQGLDASGLLSRISGAPGQFTARALSPRLLLPNTEYVAALVPAFERGRLVGLARIPADKDGPDAGLNDTAVLSPWNTGDSPFALPAYYSWRFTTGSIGDFEQAARKITPFALPDTVGRRDMDVHEPGLALPQASSGSLPVEGALMSVAAAEAPPPNWPTDEHNTFVNALAGIINAANVPTIADPGVVPPLYGQWYAAANLLDHPQRSTNPQWFFELNSDPRTRVAAALGTQVIQREDQALLASGWQQVGEIREVNDTLRVLQLVRGALGSAFTRHFLSADIQRFYQLTLRLHGWVTCGDSTVCGHLGASSVVPGFLSSQWQRLTTRRGTLGRLQGRPDAPGFLSHLLEQLADCKKPAPEPPPPIVNQPGDPRGSLPCAYIDLVAGMPNSGALFWGLVILWTVRKLMISQNGDCWWIALKALRYAISLIEIAVSGADAHRRCKFFDHTLTVTDIQNAPPMPAPFTPFAVLPDVFPTPAIPGPPGSDTPDAAAIRAALVHLLQTLVLNPVALCPPAIDLEECLTELKAALVPELTVGADFHARIETQFAWNPVDPLEPMFAPPEYERPMYEPLAAISPDWILPGLNGIDANSISLAVTNQRFVEAYMTGLNHEMTRELLWNEFPTDQRGTYFRQFWDIAGCILEDGSTLPPDQLRDVLPFRLWDASKGLGLHSPRLPGGDGGIAGMLVLVIRADLVRKYPNVVVYAQRRDAVSNRLTGTQNRPVFQARIEPDIAFYGFNLTVAQIQSDEDLYFVLQEHPGDPKFADEKTVDPATRSDALRYSSPGALLGDTAGAVAQNTFLQPFRIGFQAKSMLPPATP